MNEFMHDLIEANSGLQSFQEIIDSIMEFNDTALTPTLVENISESIRSLITPEMRASAVAAMKKDFDTRQVYKAEVAQYYENLKNSIDNLIRELKPSQQKLSLLNSVFTPMLEIVEEVVNTYHIYDISVLMKLDEGAKLPTYAHDTDACADIYASQNIVLPAHSQSNMVHTGIHMALPENWVFMIDPRSSIGYKTGLRLSNSVGIIDEDYRGEIGVLYDNISDSDYEIKAGDRIAQGWVQPVYRFKPVKVDILPATERGNGGFGSTGK